MTDAHRDLDAEVAAAYGPADISEENALAGLLELNLRRGEATDVPPTDEGAANGDDD
jgi:hypothetical protein